MREGLELRRPPFPAAGAGIPPVRHLVLIAAAILLQIQLVFTATAATPDEPFGVLVAAAVAAPFLLIAILSASGWMAASTPLFILIPGYILGFIAAQWVLLAAVFGAMLAGGSSGRLPGAPSRLEQLYATYVVWAAVCTLQAVDFGEALVGMKPVVASFLAFLAGRRVVGAARAFGQIRIFAFLAVAITVQLVIVSGSRSGLFAGLSMNRGLLTDLGWGHSNFIAAMAALSAAAGLPLLLYGRFPDRILGAFSAGGAVLVSVITQSRGGMVALAFLFVLTGLLEFRRRVLPVLLVMALVAGAVVASPLGRVSLIRFTTPQEALSVGARLAFYVETAGIIRENWLLGVGPAQIPHHTSYLMGPYPHNILLKNAADLGIPGLLLYLALLGGVAAAVLRFRRRAADARSRLLALAALLTLGVAAINASYEPTLDTGEYGLVFWLVMGTLLAAGEDRSDRAEGAG